MADGTPQNGTALVAADEITTDNGVTVSARQAQRIKLDSKGVDGAFTDVSQAAPLPVMRPDAATTGTIMVTDAVVPAPTGNGALLSGASTALSLIALACPGGDSAWNVQITGLTSGTLYFEGSLDSTSGTDGNWINVNGRRTGVVNTELAGNATANGVWRGNTSGLVYFRVRAVGALVGTPAIRIRISDGTGAVFLNASTPAGLNLTGYNGLPLHRGRVIRNFILNSYIAAPAADALQSVEQWYANAAVAATTQPVVVPAGKVLRLFGMRLSSKSLATVGSAVLRLRANTGGLVAIGSPLVCSLEVGSRAGATTVAMTGGLDQAQIAWDEGVEFPAGTGIGFSLAGYGPAGVLSLQGVTRFEAWGAEYTA